ncbi:hypothetical protein GC209_06055 [bacterium]|nr:hypothetical protein [bacterium]
MLKSVLLALPLGVSAMAAAAATDLMQRDPACTHIATVQYLDCQVQWQFTCPAADGLAGPLMREEVYDETGYSGMEVDTANGAMLVAGDVKGNFVVQADAATLVETPLAETIRTGKGAFSSKATVSMMGLRKPSAQRVQIVATGEKQIFSGIETIVFDAAVALDVPKPMGPITSVSKAYLVPSLGLYLSGEETSGTFYSAEKTPHRPTLISMPGQPGFETTKPGTCGGSLSRLDRPISPERWVPQGVPS